MKVIAIYDIDDRLWFFEEVDEEGAKFCQPEDFVDIDVEIIREYKETKEKLFKMNWEIHDIVNKQRKKQRKKNEKL